ncbi:MAG: glutamyl-tRNA reductase [Candidatus Hydrothermarchaeota archaeon]
MEIINVRLTHKKADMSMLESAFIRDIPKALREIKALDFPECCILQTCNRIEFYCVGKENSEGKIVQYLVSNVFEKSDLRDCLVRKGTQNILRCIEEEVKKINMLKEKIEVEKGENALRHLLRVASGIESMMVGEDQILGQVKEAYRIAKENGDIGKNLDIVFRKAINVGKKVRKETNINVGSVSIGSAAVDLAESIIGSLKDITVLVVGAGKMASLVAKSLKKFELKVIFVANRTYEKGVELAKELKGIAIRFSDLDDALVASDLVICATGAPHPIINKERLEKILQKRGGTPLLIIDIANPRDVDKDVKTLKNVKLCDIDDLRAIAEENIKRRKNEIKKVEEIVENELKHLEKELIKQKIEPILSRMYKGAEEVRQKELTRALGMLKDLDPENKEVIEDMTKAMVKKILAPMIENLKKAAENGNIEFLHMLHEAL